MTARKKTDRPKPAIPGKHPMPRNLKDRETAIYAWCTAHSGPKTDRILQELGFTFYAREAWDKKLRGRTLQQLWNETAEIAAKTEEAEETEEAK